MANPAWFDANYFAQQKVAQMNATSYQMGDGEWLALNGNGATAWTTALYNQYIAEATFGGQTVTPYENFEACNAQNYGAGVTLADVNVSPNQYFNVEQYLQALANYNNANPDAYEGVAPAGGWTVESVLNEIFNTHHSSVWEHYNQAWSQNAGVNPSNAFDADAYIASYAAATGVTADAARQEIVASGLNPVQHYFEVGQAAGASVSAVSAPVTPALPDATWTIWGEPVTPPDPVEPLDPFEQNVTSVNIASGQTVYPGEGETYAGNTQFDAQWLPSSAASTLNAKDVITGPADQYNTLSVTLGKNWTGFNGKLADGTEGANVSQIGRIELVHTNQNNEASYTFNAKGISEDAYRFDLVGASGPGSISVNNLSKAVNEIHISDITPKDTGNKAPADTAINFVDSANNGKTDALTLVLENVGASGGREAAITSKHFGIEDLTIQTQKGDGQSYVDLSDLTGVKTLTFTGAGNIQVTNVASGISTYDASAATGNVNMAIVNPRSSTVVRGGAGSDTVTISSGNWTPAGLDNVENLAITNGATVKLSNVGAGLTDLWGLQNGGTVKDLTADNFTAHLATKAGNVTVDGDKEGSLINLTWATANNEDKTPGTDEEQWAGSLSTNATGTVTLNVGESATRFFANGFSASAATELVVNAACGVWLNSPSPDKDLQSVQNVTLNLSNSSTDPNNGPDFTGIFANLKAAQNVVVNADGQAVSLQDLGSEKGDGSVNLDVNDAAYFHVGNIAASLGCNIDVDIAAEGHVAFGNHIKNTTNVINGNEGDIHVAVSGTTVGAVDVDGDGNPDDLTINGGPLTIDFSEVSGNAFETGGLKLTSAGTIAYQGAEGIDNVTVTGNIGVGTSTFAMNDGDDSFTIANGLKVGENGGKATINVDLGTSGVNGDKVTINDLDEGSYLRVNVTNYESGGVDSTDTDDATGLLTKSDDGTATQLTATQASKINAVLKKFGFDFTVDNSTDIVDGVRGSAIAHDGDLYVVCGETDARGNATWGLVTVFEDCASLS